MARIQKTCEGTGQLPTADAQCPYCPLEVWEEDLRRDGTIPRHGTWRLTPLGRKPA